MIHEWWLRDTLEDGDTITPHTTTDLLTSEAKLRKVLRPAKLRLTHLQASGYRVLDSGIRCRELGLGFRA